MKLAQNGIFTKLALFFEKAFGQPKDAMETMPVIEANPPFLYEATLAVEGAKARLDRANQVIRAFHFEHGDPRSQMRAESFAHHDSLLREYEILLIEADDAHRGLEKALQDFCAVKKAAGLTTSLRQGAKNV
jgi:hypothetical protein